MVGKATGFFERIQMTKQSSPSKFDEWFDLLDLSAVADPDDKIAECEYFLALASAEQNVLRFRWLISAFFNAAYSFFEIRALAAFHAFWDDRNEESNKDSEAVDTLRRYVKIVQNAKNPSFVKTAGLCEATEQLYELRTENTHHHPLSIMVTGPFLPEDFHFGDMTGRGTPALAFCRKTMALIRQVQQELQA